jgi:hypothetical protein
MARVDARRQHVEGEGRLLDEAADQLTRSQKSASTAADIRQPAPTGSSKPRPARRPRQFSR